MWAFWTRLDTFGAPQFSLVVLRLMASWESLSFQRGLLLICWKMGFIVTEVEEWIKKYLRKIIVREKGGPGYRSFMDYYSKELGPEICRCCHDATSSLWEQWISYVLAYQAGLSAFWGWAANQGEGEKAYDKWTDRILEISSIPAHVVSVPMEEGDPDMEGLWDWRTSYCVCWLFRASPLGS